MSTEEDSVHMARVGEATLWEVVRDMLRDVAKLGVRLDTVEADTTKLKHTVEGIDDRLDEYHQTMTRQLGDISEKQAEMGQAVDSIKITVEGLSPIQSFAPTLASLAAREEARAQEEERHRKESAELRTQIKRGLVAMLLAALGSLLSNAGVIPEQARIALVALVIVAVGAILAWATLKRYFGGAR